MLTTTECGRVGLVLVAQKDNAQYVIGLPLHLHLSGVLTELFCDPAPSFDGRVEIPFSSGIAYQLVAQILRYGDDAGRHMYSDLRSHFADNSDISLHTELTIVLTEVTNLSVYLEIPSMLEYKDFIIDHALMYYVSAVRNKFYSGKLRGAKRYEQAVSDIMEQIDKLDEFISLQRVKEYRDSINENTAERQQGIDDRYTKRKELIARKRKRLEE